MSSLNTNLVDLNSPFLYTSGTFDGIDSFRQLGVPASSSSSPSSSVSATNTVLVSTYIPKPTPLLRNPMFVGSAVALIAVVLIVSSKKR